MTRIPKSIFSFGALVLAAGALTLAVPPAAHAVAAALVQVNNPITSPATTQDISKQANQFVHLLCIPNRDGTPELCNLVLLNGATEAPFIVTTVQSLVINAIDIVQGASSQTQITTSNYSWTISGTNTVHFAYPSGLVFGPDTTLTLASSNNSASGVTVNMYGYLTTN
jgi:hypothetical protein